MPMLIVGTLPRQPATVDLDLDLAVKRAMSTDECPICLATLNSCVETPCGHLFHAACLEHYFNISGRQAGQRSRCPLCRCSVHAPRPVEVRSTSGRPIEIVPVPARGSACHLDRQYRFIHLGDFEGKPLMQYVLTSNEDRKTSARSVMWVLDARVACTVYLNFRSERHVTDGQAERWLHGKGFERDLTIRSTSSTGFPNGPYSGPVFSRTFDAPQSIELMGSNTWEGTYFVFVELCSSSGQ